MIAGWFEGGYDLLLTPTMAEPPPPLGTYDDSGPDPLRRLRRAVPAGAFTALFNATGQPAISLPLHWTDDGLPVGVQLVAPFGREDLLIRRRRAARAARSRGPTAARRSSPAEQRDTLSPMAEIRGVITAMVTPFDADGARRPRRGARGSRATWSRTARTASSSPAPPASRRRSPTTRSCALLDAVLDEVGDEATVIAGTGSNDTRHAVELTAKAPRGRRRTRCSSVTPYYNKPNQAGLRAHFAAVAEAAGETPIVLYNIPSRCVINMPPELLAELAATNANIVAVKQANNDELGPIEGLEILAGNDDVFARTLELRRRRAGSSSPRTSSAARCARSTTRRAPATTTARREIDAELRADLRGDDGDRRTRSR